MSQDTQAGTQLSGHWGLNEWLLILVPIIVVVLFVAYVRRKGRSLPGDHVFRASRLGRGNHLFPAQVIIEPSSITFCKPQWIGKLEESINMAHIASVRIDTHLLFADVYIETSGGQDPIVCHGHTKGDVVEMKKLIEKFQTEYYKGQKQ
jgi:hypothetical protein